LFLVAYDLYIHRRYTQDSATTVSSRTAGSINQ
jgi:hypothetical protein